jgi:hypothetical protein
LVSVSFAALSKPQASYREGWPESNEMDTARAYFIVDYLNKGEEAGRYVEYLAIRFGGDDTDITIKTGN